ncbi:hypothetical protein R3P38DRAFT_3049321 [Favolaschia claudopus]|uniref:F-box domain-containing protein n=1 Tax=Favolaschia claudopus TaxID=2862362 RepID=A0AAW0A6H3_9AGAR
MDPFDAENLNSSPFHQHLHTNYIPTDAEIGAIRAHLLPHEAELARLDALIRDLSSQRDRVKRYVASHQALISHPRRLPQDIIEEIFLASLPTQHNAAMTASEPPLLLGRICSRWRSIAFSLPGLWNTLHISADLVDREGMPTAITDWLTRASVLPLAISAHWNDPDRYDFDFDFNAATLIDTLIPFSSRWSILRLSNVRQGAFWRVADVDAPLLSDVQIDFGSDNFVGADHPVPTGILHSKILLGGNQPKISIAIRRPSLLVPVTSFIWNHITSLTLKEPRGGMELLNLDATMRLLKGCPRLKVLALSVFLEGQGQASNDPLIATCLESLSLGVSKFKLVSNFIDHVSMPELKTIRDIHLDLSDFSSTISIIRALHSFHHIRTLGIVLRALTTERNTDHVELNELFNILDPEPEFEINPVPLLEELSLQTKDFPEVVWENYLQSHIHQRTCFRRLRLHLWREEPVSEYPDVSEFLAERLDVVVNYGLIETPNVTPWDGIE